MFVCASQAVFYVLFVLEEETTLQFPILFFKEEEAKLCNTQKKRATGRFSNLFVIHESAAKDMWICPETRITSII